MIGKKKLSNEEIETLLFQKKSEQIRKLKLREEEQQLINKNKVVVLKSNELHKLHNVGAFKIAHFVFPDLNGHVITINGFIKSLSNKIFCFVLDNKNNSLNIDWKNGTRYNFKIRNLNDYKKAQQFYKEMKNKGFQISNFYSE